MKKIRAMNKAVKRKALAEGIINKWLEEQKIDISNFYNSGGEFEHLSDSEILAHISNNEVDDIEVTISEFDDLYYAILEEMKNKSI